MGGNHRRPRRPSATLTSAGGICLLITWLLASAVASAQTPAFDDGGRHLHTYAMQHAIPEQVLPALQPLLSPGSSARSFNDQLVLNVTDAEYASIRELLRQIDAAPRSLLISVRSAGTHRSDRSDYRIGADIGSGAVRATNGGARDGQVVLRADRRTASEQRDGTRQVRAVEGMPAFISTGVSVPVTTVDAAGNPVRTQVPVESGFYAIVRVIGDDVVIDIDQRDDRLAHPGIATEGLHTHSLRTQSLRTQSLSTQVRGRLGEWISIGTADTRHSDDEQGWSGSHHLRQTGTDNIALRVDYPPSAGDVSAGASPESPAIAPR